MGPLGLLLLLGVFHWTQASLVKVNAGLRVKRGQSAYLQEGDLQFDIPRVKDSCKVEVVLNEPITQRVGTLTPQVFDCHFLTDEVKYVHNGCPILRRDTVMLRLYRFTDTDTYTEVFYLNVKILEPDCNVIKLGPRILAVPEFYGLSDPLDGNVLSFHYEHRPNLECTVRVSTQETHLPAHGQLVIGELEKLEPRGDEPESFIPIRQQLLNKARAKCKDEACRKGLKLVQTTKVPCEEFLVMGLRYQHSDPPSPDIDYIAIRLDLTDTRSRTIYKSERAWIPVSIKHAVRNQQPRQAFMSTFILEVDQFILTPLTTATLDAEDSETPKPLLVFNISKPPREGFFTHLSDHTRPITSFTWMDLNDMLIAYQPPNSSHTQRRNYEVDFQVHDFFFERSPPIMVHVSVRTADTNAPRVSWNMGISLLEGQSRPITWEQLQIVDNDNLKAVRLITVDGLQHGRLTVNGGKGFMFSVNDIKAGVVCYHHDDSDTTKDYVVFRITDGRHQTRHKFPINILPKDDSPPFLITNMVLELSEGQTALLRGSILQASDMDSSDDYILFNITRPPQAGELMKIPAPGLTGYPVSRFLQKDLFHSVMFYRHLGNEVFDDSFEVVLSDFHDPPNLSEPQVIVVHIIPVHDQLPREAPGVTRHLVVKETEVIHLTKKQLHFIDPESPDSELTYTVTTPPFYSSNYGRNDAGRLFLVDTIPKLTKDANAPVLRLFTQHAVNYMKVAYMPPILDIGPYPQHIELVLSVSNQQGSTITGICFNITVLPVDNQAPEVYTNQLTVEEGGDCLLGLEHLLLTDQDSMEDALRVELKREPHHGYVELDGFPMKSGQVFTVKDLKSLKVRYHHDSTETVQDDIVFIATDGINAVDFVLQVKVILVNDEIPVMMPGLKPMLDCAEGQEVVITIEYLYATDNDSDDSRLFYMIARQPYHGVVCKNGFVVDRFIQADITAGIITYKHTGGEIGRSPRHDIITFVISDGETETLPSCCPNEGPSSPRHTNRLQQTLPVYDLNITIFPVNSQPPSIAIRDVFVVDEGGSAAITVAHLRTSDMDTPLEELELILVSPPQFGYIENILPSPGFEKSNMGISIGTFSYKDVMNGHINYVQSRHQRIEPTKDQFMVCVSDGKHRSADTPFYIIISPINDEIPEFLARNITVREGDMKELDPTVLNAVDLDVPHNDLVFSVVQQPQHGMIMGRLYGNDITRYKRLVRRGHASEVAVQDFTLEELKNGMTVMYMHDDSESMQDGFTIELSDGKHRLQKHVTVNVVPVNDEAPRLIRNYGIEVEMGESRLISSAVLSAEDGDTPAQHVLYVFESVPTDGLLQIKVDSDWVPLSVGMNCSQEAVDMNLLRYLHTGSAGSQGEDFFVFHLQDGSNRCSAQHFYITVKDMEKGEIAVFVKPVKASRGERLVLTTDALLAVDRTDKPEELLYTITAPPSHGHIEYIKHPGVPINTFSQMDVAANLVCYVHDNRGTSPRETIRFVVNNGQFTRNGTLEIAVEMTDRVLPSLSRNGGLRVFQGSTMALSSDDLSLYDPDTPPASLFFLLAQPPQYGQLLLKGAPLTGGNFTQQHLLDLDLAYRHAGGPSQIDRFSFTASDGTNQGFLVEGRIQAEPVIFSIQMEAPDSPTPRVVQLQSVWKVELLKDGRYGMFVSSRELKAQDTDNSDEEITFHILRPPYFGYLENATTGQFVNQRFTQKDLNRRTILYIISSALEALSDSVEFQVSDPQGNAGSAHTLEFAWSRVELAQTEITACEDQGTLSLTVLRKGNTAESSYVSVKVKEVTATAGKDFTLSPSTLIQFDPGVTSRSWRIRITQDQLEEAEEMFEVALTSPVSTVLGSVTKARVKIVDAKKGHCGSSTVLEGPRLIGQLVPQGTPPRHGAIQVESLPLTQQDSGGWTRGDGVAPFEPPASKKRLRTNGNGMTVRPSSVHKNGSDLVFTYHGIMSLRVEDDSSPSRKGRKAKVLVTSRGKQTPASVSPGKKAVPAPDISVPRLTAQGPAGGSSPKACAPELTGLLHFNQSSSQLLRCDGMSWRPWALTDEMVGAQKCPAGWTYHGGCCYFLATEQKATWSMATRACRENHNGNLVSILSKTDMDWLWDFSGRKPFWIGLNDRENKGRWEWVGGEPVTYTNWRKSPPRVKRKGAKNCVLVRRRAKWQMQDCKKGKRQRYMCYLKT
ncbi:FRAS1-related extracellular matrix protein 1a isoform X1 [Conger conger]|uniref:FRAS1-related extracellular matrix protein 1a isoform X1 n=1 Tax=Conger conger TaxID=82655 RepID=UPI002A5ABD35|nr:FRAS1-related extracellular matrix protein 1a isoform X1 [Conger conger]